MGLPFKTTDLPLKADVTLPFTSAPSQKDLEAANLAALRPPEFGVVLSQAVETANKKKLTRIHANLNQLAQVLVNGEAAPAVSEFCTVLNKLSSLRPRNPENDSLASARGRLLFKTAYLLARSLGPEGLEQINLRLTSSNDVILRQAIAFALNGNLDKTSIATLLRGTNDSDIKVVEHSFIGLVTAFNKLYPDSSQAIGLHEDKGVVGQIIGGLLDLTSEFDLYFTKPQQRREETNEMLSKMLSAGDVGNFRYCMAAEFLHRHLSPQDVNSLKQILDAKAEARSIVAKPSQAPVNGVFAKLFQYVIRPRKVSTT